MRTKQDDSAIDCLLAFSNRYTGPNANRVPPGCYASAEAIHEDLVYQKLTRWASSTQASFKAICRKFIEWCEKDELNTDVYKFFAHPATKVRAFLESERQRHIQQGTQPGINVANTFTEMVKLSMIQGCPSFDNAAIDHIKAVVARAKNDSAQQNRIAELDYSKSRADRAVLTDEDTNNFLEVCSKQGDRLAAARAQVILLIGCATGFRACGMIHLTYYNMIRTEPNQYNTAHPQQLDILGVGTDRHKTLSTGKVVYTGLTRHAMAEKDAVAAIGELLALEVHSSRLALLEQMKHGEKTRGRVNILFPGYVDLSEKAQTDNISNLFNRITGQIQGWDKSKVTGLLRKTCVETLRAADASKAEVDFHGGWNGGTQDRNYARESLQADMKAQAKAAGFVKDFREHHYLGRADIHVPEAWHNALLPGLQALLDAVLDLPCEVRETLQCIELFVQAFWQALPIKRLKYGADCGKKQLDKVQEVMATDEYGIFATNVREAELDSMEKLGLKVPYLETWAQEQATLNYAAKGSAAEPDKPATKRLRLGSVEVQAAIGSTLAQKLREYAAHAEAIECRRLDMRMSQERAQLAKEIAETDAAIAADNRAAQAAQTQTMARAARDLLLDPGCKMPLVSGYTDVLIQPPAASHKPSVVKQLE